MAGPDEVQESTVKYMEKKKYSKLYRDKKLYRAFRQQANGLTLNTPVFQGLLRVNGKAEKDA